MRIFFSILYCMLLLITGPGFTGEKKVKTDSKKISHSSEKITLIRSFMLICLICGNLWLIFLGFSWRLCGLAGTGEA